jgi:hypothetical protein
VLRSSHAVILRQSLKAYVDISIIPKIQRCKLHAQFDFIADCLCHIVEALKRSMQYVIPAGGVKLGIFKARKVTRTKNEQMSACSLQRLNTKRIMVPLRIFDKSFMSCLMQF